MNGTREDYEAAAHTLMNRLDIYELSEMMHLVSQCDLHALNAYITGRIKFGEAKAVREAIDFDAAFMTSIQDKRSYEELPDE
ncbi:hypothetical protein [Paenirhodobacter populi]|uniref:hypothetical protein n=1 Tax=Paenirhodobacter populi TaxID=2306993 RepID=UPI000FE3CE68|nr:hypothetical protein [Sinirhodobacter populi]RWR05097.1 hypothetical protein D2T32_17785 [Sinirhodobacter populi]